MKSLSGLQLRRAGCLAFLLLLVPRILQDLITSVGLDRSLWSPASRLRLVCAEVGVIKPAFVGLDPWTARPRLPRLVPTLITPLLHSSFEIEKVARGLIRCAVGF